MWEELKVYKQLPKKEINPAFRKFGRALLSNLPGYTIDQTNSIIKLSRQINQLEQSVFIEKSVGGYDMEVRIGIKPIDFYLHYKYTMINIIPLGKILNNFRRSQFPLTQEWNDLSIYLADIIKNEVGHYFQSYDTYEKIISLKEKIEISDADNKYELLIYAAARIKNKSLLINYIDKKLAIPTMRITHSQYISPNKETFEETQFLERIKSHALQSNFEGVETEFQTIACRH